MLVEVYLTVFLIALIVAGILAWLLLPPLLRRLNYESRIERQIKARQEEERRCRAEAERELDAVFKSYQTPEKNDETLKEDQHP